MIIKLNKDEMKEVKKEIIDDVVKSTLRSEIQKEIQRQFTDTIKDEVKAKVKDFNNYILKDKFDYELKRIIANTFCEYKNWDFNAVLNEETKEELKTTLFEELIKKVNIDNLKELVKGEIRRKLLEEYI